MASLQAVALAIVSLCASAANESHSMSESASTNMSDSLSSASAANESHGMLENVSTHMSDPLNDGPLQASALLSLSSTSYNSAEAQACARISAATYCKEAGPGVSHAQIIGSRSELAVVGRWEGHCIAAFRGTDNLKNIEEDVVSLLLVPLPGCSGCMVGDGILQAYQKLAGGVKKALHRLGCTEVAVTGHSLGANLAILALLDLHKSGFRLRTSYTFGQARIGNVAFHNAWKAAVGGTQVVRFVHGKDPIVRLGPLGSSTYEGTEVYLPGDSVAQDHSCYLSIAFKTDTLLRGRVCGTSCSMYP